MLRTFYSKIICRHGTKIWNIQKVVTQIFAVKYQRKLVPFHPFIIGLRLYNFALIWWWNWPLWQRQLINFRSADPIWQLISLIDIFFHRWSKKWQNRGFCDPPNMYRASDYVMYFGHNPSIRLWIRIEDNVFVPNCTVSRTVRGHSNNTWHSRGGG